VVVDGDQRIDPAPPETTKRFSFHLPFFRNVPPISQTLTPPPPSLNPSPGPYQDGRSSVASSSFPTFAPLDKPVYPNHRPNESDDAADGSRTWIDEDSCAPTTLQGHETPEALELDVKSPDEDDGTYRLSYRENANCTPSSTFCFSSYPALLIPGVPRDISPGLCSALGTPNSAIAYLSSVRFCSFTRPLFVLAPSFSEGFRLPR
jgi:hypothetical protein